MCYLGCRYERYVGNDCRCTLPRGKNCPCDEETEIEEIDNARACKDDERREIERDERD